MGISAATVSGANPVQARPAVSSGRADLSSHRECNGVLCLATDTFSPTGIWLRESWSQRGKSGGIGYSPETLANTDVFYDNDYHS
jgi:hypothetical protein